MAAITERFQAKAAILVLGIALLSFVVEGTRRALLDSGSRDFDVTSYGAKADGETDDAMVSSNSKTQVIFFYYYY